MTKKNEDLPINPKPPEDIESNSTDNAILKDWKQKGIIWIPYGILFFVPLFFLLFYSRILSQDYSSANFGTDGGDFLAAALTNGISHPSGYPLYTFLLKTIQFFPNGTPYFKGSLLSLISFSLSISLIGFIPLWATQSSVKKIIATGITVFVFGTAPLVVSQAVIVEVYGLQTFFTVLYLFWAYCTISTPFRKRNPIFWLGLSILCGLGLSNHLTTAFLIPVYIIGLIFLDRNGYSKRFIFLCLIFYLSGLLFYGTLPWLAAANPLVNWGNPRDIKSLYWLVSGQIYQELAGGITLPVLGERVMALAGILFENGTIPGVLAGLFYICRMERKDFFRGISLYLFLASIIFSLFYGSNDSIVYLIPAVVILSMWIGLSIELLWAEKIRNLVWGRGLILLVFIFLLLRPPNLIGQIDPRQEKGAAFFAEQVLSLAPPNAIILTSGDEDTFPLWYYHYGLKKRNDLTIITLGLFQFDWYRESLLFHSPDFILIPPGDSQYDPTWMKTLSDRNQLRPVCRSWLEEKNQINLAFQCY